MMITNEIVKGIITQINNDGTMQVRDSIGQLHSRVHLLPIYGLSTIPFINNTSQVILFRLMNNSANIVGIPYNFTDQKTNLSTSEQGEVKCGSPKAGNYIQFKPNGEININPSSGSEVNIAGASANALNENATIQVTIPPGGTGGTFTAVIIDSGQDKVKI